VNREGSFTIVPPHQILFGWSNTDKWEGRDMQHVWVRGEVHTGIGWEILREREHLEDLRVDKRIILKNLQEIGWRCEMD
jgi:hypothetical protein